MRPALGNRDRVGVGFHIIHLVIVIKLSHPIDVMIFKVAEDTV